MLPIKYVILIYILWNCCVFITMGRDKKKAKMGQWRISEATLLWMGVFGGVGLFAGMKYFHHKTSHPKFLVAAPVFVIFNTAILGFLIYKHIIV
ncbi:hypothetical protein DEAC_c41300 [Desulfosporosinus acididurans]|uniref:DUF1294 domain-containing protein n=1 Tax=Desulfosporosinus acididurans TaxID=476652 RepID=A0A0J1IGT1_9FIRM|nr:DUF1294 domain-containing protein [Desulfosporosinus acididurans]KLU63901.1 hypothetical protein DEAC_c41300 [Desulfosporosinus acididurans]